MQLKLPLLNFVNRFQIYTYIYLSIYIYLYFHLSVWKVCMYLCMTNIFGWDVKLTSPPQNPPTPPQFCTFFGQKMAPSARQLPKIRESIASMFFFWFQKGILKNNNKNCVLMWFKINLYIFNKNLATHFKFNYLINIFFLYSTYKTKFSIGNVKRFLEF